MQRELGAFDPAGDVPVGSATAAYHRFYETDFTLAFSGLRQRMGWLAVGDHRIAVQDFRPASPRGTALLVHGYYDHVGLYGHAIRYLLDQQLHVVTMDLPGHGLSSGARATIDDFGVYADVIDAVKGLMTNAPEPWHAMAQSMGAAALLESIRRTGQNPFTEVVLLAPLVRPAAWAINRVVFEIARRTITERPRTITHNAENAEFMQLMYKDPLAPMILPVQWVSAMVAWKARFVRTGSLPINARIVQGHSDRTVDWRYNLKVLDRMMQTDVLHLPDARHHLVNESDEVRALMWAWLTRRCRW